MLKDLVREGWFVINTPKWGNGLEDKQICLHAQTNSTNVAANSDESVPARKSTPRGKGKNPLRSREAQAQFNDSRRRLRQDESSSNASDEDENPGPEYGDGPRFIYVRTCAHAHGSAEKGVKLRIDLPFNQDLNVSTRTRCMLLMRLLST